MHHGIQQQWDTDGAIWEEVVLGGLGPGSGEKDELRIFEGKESGRTLVVDTKPSYYISPVPMKFHALGGRLLFSTSNGLVGREIWVIDGNASGTCLVRDINAVLGDLDPGGNPAVFLFCTLHIPRQQFPQA